MKAFAKFATRLLIVLLLLLGGGIIYLDVDGFPPFLKALVEEQLASRGFPTHFASIHLDVLRGVIASDAVVTDAKVPDQVIARIDELQINWNWPRLFRHQFAIDSIWIANATVSVPTPPDEIGPEVFKADQAYATFQFEDDGSVQIKQLTGVYAGIRLDLSGRLESQLTANNQSRRPSGAGRSPFVFVTKALRELNNLHGKQSPQLNVTFDLDLASPMGSQVSGKLVAVDVVYRKINVEKLVVEVEMQDGAIDVRQASLQVGKGELSVVGRYDIAGGGFDLKLDSSLDPNQFLPGVPESWENALRDLRVMAPPKISARYVLSPETGDLPVLQGRMDFGALEFRTVQFRSIGFSYEIKGPDVKITDAKIVMREGQLTGRGQYNLVKSNFTYEVDSTLDPHKLLPIMFPKARQIVEPSWFETPPHIVAAVCGDFVDPEHLAYDATLTTGGCSYRGVALQAVSAQLKLQHNKLDVRDLVVQREEGEVGGAVAVDFDAHQIGFNLVGTVNPSEMAPILGPVPRDFMRPYRFGPRTVGTAHGLIDLDVQSNCCWQAHVSNEGFSYWKLTADKATADLIMTNNTLTIDNFDGDLYGGKLRGKALFNLEKTSPYRFDFETTHMDIHRLLGAIRGKDVNASGFLSGQAVIAGQGDDLGKLKGGGKLAVTDGILWEIPIFGIFSHVLNDLGTDLGTTKATRADATFTIEDRSIRTDDMTVSAGAFTLTGAGKVGFDGKLDFRIQGQLLRSWPGLNIVTWLLKNVFAYKIGGSLGDYTYRPVNLPKEFLPHTSGSSRDKAPPPASPATDN